jgi:hypothetical protein
VRTDVGSQLPDGIEIAPATTPMSGVWQRFATK